LLFLDSYAFICFGGAGIWTAVPLFLSFMVGQFEGREKRAVSIAIINGFGECPDTQSPSEQVVLTISDVLPR
jgi:hypothetical protein